MKNTRTTFPLRLPDETHRKLKFLAGAAGLSANALLLELIDWAFEASKLPPPPEIKQEGLLETLKNTALWRFANPQD